MIPPVVCRPWCAEGDGHRDEHLHEDQRCTQSLGEVERTLAPLVPDIMDEFHPQAVEVIVDAGPCTVEQVVVYQQVDDIELRFTLRESQRLIEMLTEAVGLLQGDHGAAS